MSSIALKVYQGLTEETDEKVKARLIADAFEELEQRYPEVKDLATGAQLTEKSLILQKEIKEIEASLQKDMREIESNLQKDMREIESNLQKDMRKIESNLRKDINRQTWMLIGGIPILITVLSIIQKAIH